MNTRLIFAWTAPGGMPEFVNISECGENMVEITVRGLKKPPGKLPYESVGDMASMRLSAEQYREMADAIRADIYRNAEAK